MQQLLPFRNAVIIDFDHKQVIMVNKNGVKGYKGKYFKYMTDILKEWQEEYKWYG